MIYTYRKLALYKWYMQKIISKKTSIDFCADIWEQAIMLQFDSGVNSIHSSVFIVHRKMIQIVPLRKVGHQAASSSVPLSFPLTASCGSELERCFLILLPPPPSSFSFARRDGCTSHRLCCTALHCHGWAGTDTACVGAERGPPWGLGSSQNASRRRSLIPRCTDFL